MAQFSFDASNVKPNQGAMPPIPKGIYRSIMIASEIKPTSSGTGAFIEAQFKVVGGQYDGHIIYHNFNIRNASEKAVEIGYGQLSAVCHAIGILNFQDTSQLHNRPLAISVKIGGGGKRPEGGEYEERNEIASFKKDEAQAGPAAAPTIIPPPTPVAPTPPSTPVAAPAPVAAPVIPAAPAPVAPAPAPVPAPEPVRQMTAAANGATYEQFIAQGWTDELLVQHGMIELVAPAPAIPAAPAAPAAPIAAAKQPWETANPVPEPAAPAPAAVPGAPAGDVVPPWLQQK